MKSQEIRAAFVDFFVRKQHRHMPAASLVPDAMSTTLFTIAGMEQFVPVFLGREPAPAPRVVTVQPCLRVAGGKNDLENVGRSGRHGTFLEMLGNFSFGDYYKREAILWAWEFLTATLELPAQRLFATVYVDDDEAAAIWQTDVGLDAAKVTRFREDNFWDMGPTGPCGPCSEIFYDLGPSVGCGRADCGVGCAHCDRYIEIWNLVFQQYDRDAAGTLHALPRTGIDTGMGFERLCMVLAEKTSIFDTDLYQDIIASLPEPVEDGELAQADQAVHRRIIADHARAAVFLAADGVSPSNTDRGYVMRFLMRRALRSGRRLRLPDGFFSGLSSLAACEGAILVVDAAQGVEAQTLANVNLAHGNHLTIVPVINKIDLPAADPERVKQEIEDVLAIEASECILASAKAGIGTHEILEAVVKRIPAPTGRPEAPLRALIFDSHFDPYLGTVAYVRVVDGALRPGMRIRMMSTRREFELQTVGTFRPEMIQEERLLAGEVGYVTAGVKTVGDCRVGDTITDAEGPASEALPGYKQAKPMVFCGLYPVDSDQYPDLREALLKLQLNDASLTFEPETSAALGFGFRCGFLGLLHSEIVQERLEREFELSLIATSPSVVYRVTRTDETVIEIDNPASLPPANRITHIEEPYVDAMIICPTEYVGTCMELCNDRRGIFKNMEYSGRERVILTYRLPLSEILMDFFDQLKSRTKGYASFDYEYSGYETSKLVKLDIQLNGQPVDALSFITHHDRAFTRGKQLVERLKEILPRQMFEIRIQAALGSKVIAAESVKAMRKNVLAKCYGGDITRKRKLLEKQKEGKKRMKQVGSVEIPQEAFLSVLKVGGG